MELVVFVLAAAMVLGGALGVVTRSNPVIVYAGAIVVLFLFVIMLLGVDESEDLSVEPIAKQRPLALILGGGLVAIIIAAVVTGRENFSAAGGALESATLESPDANIRALARSIFSTNVFAFEITSVLLLVAVVGTVVMARRMKSLGTGK